MTARALGALALAFVLTLAVAKPFIGWLRARQLGEQIREVGLDHHQAKRGTPTMGGLFMIAVTVILALILDWQWPDLWPLCIGLLGFGLLGALDDLAKVSNRAGYGFQVRYKFLWHPGLALAIALLLYFVLGQHTVDAGPLHGLELGAGYVPMALLVIFSTSSASLVDGLDGLAGGVYALCLLAYLVIALHNGQGTLATFVALCIGALLGFLWFNVHPAQVFMGDTGALAFGGTLGVVALMSHQPLLLLLIGLALVVEVLSVGLQVIYFKLTHGKRLFLMSPFHHHLEKLGWPEVTIVQRFWLATAVTASIGTGLALL
ncbi:MAG TPA: phospho-N-acetylmuramoyl-pentapeptide-transferase [Chloroflexota bacterium]|nr:phospho-N-acetylmuramoyl-pentapeptide-transferase [Chloroflexota bacterium]